MASDVSFEIRPESIKTFIEDSSIELPRFQRKQTWNDRKNFNLCLSLFKGYPIGVVVLRRTEDPESGEAIKWLLDGRQRRNALTLLKNPEHVYAWAKKALKLRTSDSDNEVMEKFWSYAEDYFGREDYESEEEETEIFGENEEDHYDAPEEGTDEAASRRVQESARSDTDEFIGSQASPGLFHLLRIITTVHPVWGETSELTKPFDFRNAVKDVEYIELDTDSGNQHVNTQKLLSWIDHKKRIAEIEKQDFPPSKEQLLLWLTSQSSLEWTEERLKNEIDKRWDAISEVFWAVNRIEHELQDRAIGYILIKEAAANDEKKIFEIINTAGTPLTAVEILSAKPAWNIPIEDPHKDVLKGTRELYVEQMGIPMDNVVRWDYPATLSRRLKMGYIIDFSSAGFEESVTLGFKILAGWHLGGISKDDVEKLSSVENVPWGSIEFERGVNSMAEVLGQEPTLQFWKDWQIDLKGLTSVAVALNFIISMMRLWDLMGRPSSPAAADTKAFRAKGVRLLDRSIYEYVTGQWRGASDSRIAKNVSSINRDGELFAAVEQDRWDRLIDEVLTEGRIEGRSFLEKKSVDKRVKLLLYYYYVLSEQGAPNDPTVSIDVDHIIPKSAFEAAESDVKRSCHHPANLALLPRRQNIAKGDRPLPALQNSWLIDQVERYTGLNREEFEDFREPSNFPALSDRRSSAIRTAFTTHRSRALGL